MTDSEIDKGIGHKGTKEESLYSINRHHGKYVSSNAKSACGISSVKRIKYVT